MGIPSDLTVPVQLVPPPDAHALQSMDRLELVDELIDIYEEATRRIVEANIQFRRIEEHVEEQTGIFETTD